MKRITIILYGLLLLVVSLNSCFYRTAGNPFLEGLRFDGFEQVSPLVVSNKDNLFDYMNGEAETYLPFGFYLLFNQTYQKIDGDIHIMVDAYQMKNPSGAKGIFERYSRKGGIPVQEVGESVWSDGYILLFRRSQYFFRVMPDPSPDAGENPNLQDLIDLSRSADRVLREGLRTED